MIKLFKKTPKKKLESKKQIPKKNELLEEEKSSCCGIHGCSNLKVENLKK